MKYMWDKKIDVLIKTRKLFVFLFCASLIFGSAVLIYQQQTIKFLVEDREIVPYVVKVDSLGRYEAQKLQAEQLTQNIIFSQLGRFIRLWRAPFKSADVVTSFNQRQAEIYKMLVQSSTAHRYFNENFNYETIDSNVLELRVSAIYALEENSWRVDWEEIVDVGNQEREIKKYTATVNVIISPPKDAKDIQINPLGFYIQDINFGAIL